VEKDIDPVLKERRLGLGFKVGSLAALKCIADGVGGVIRAAWWC